MFENEWFPKAYAMGVSWQEFWGMNPHIIKLLAKGHQEKIKEIDALMHTMGFYNKIAYEVVMAHFGAGLAGKSSSAEYIKKPFLELQEDQTPLTEEQKQREVDRFFASEHARRVNWKRNKKAKNIMQEEIPC